MPFGGGGSKTTSSNPAYVDRGGEENYNFAKSVFFGSPNENDYYSKALAPWGYKSPTRTPSAPSPASSQPAKPSQPTDPRTGKPYSSEYTAWMNTLPSWDPRKEQYQQNVFQSASAMPSSEDPSSAFDTLRLLPSYPGERVAGMSQNEQIGSGIARDSIGISVPYFNNANSSYGQATGATNTGFGSGMADLASGRGYIPASTAGYESPFSRFPEAAGYYMSPFVKGSLDVAARELERNNAKEQMQLMGQANSRNAFGGSRSALMQTEGNRNYNQNVSDLYSKGLSDAYERAASIFNTDETRNMGQFNEERNREQKAADLFRQFAGTGADISYGAADRYKGIGDSYVNAGKARNDVVDQTFSRLMQSGGVDRSINQGRADADYANFKEQRDYPIQVMQQLAALLQGQKGEQQTTQGGSSAGETLGGLGSLASGVAELWDLSDRRMKTEVVKIGDHEIKGKGTVNKYRFRYHGKKDYHIGVMADEVEPLMPEAVHTGNGGLKMVDYQAIGMR